MNANNKQMFAVKINNSIWNNIYQVDTIFSWPNKG